MNNLYVVFTEVSLHELCVCLIINKCQVVISAIIIIKQDDVIRRWDWKGRRWPLLVEWSFTYQIYPRRTMYDPQCFKYFNINCQSLIFGRFHVKSKFLRSLEKSEDIIMLSGYFCMETVFFSMGNVFPLLHNSPFPNRAAALIYNTCLLLNSEKFSNSRLVKEQGMDPKHLESHELRSNGEQV